jgi:rhodanese-related sulfurtransferase
MNQPAAIPTIDVKEAAARRDGPDNPLVVDVREPEEFATVRLEGAALLPMSTFGERHAELPKDRPLLLMCHIGGRSAAATAYLVRNGWTNATNVAGGIDAWERAGLPVRHGTPEPGEGDLG